jgi:hypothetical protein
MFEKYKIVQLFKLHFLQSKTLSKNTLLSATGKLSQTFLVAILWKTFQIFRSILMMSLASKIAVPSMLILVEETVKNQLESCKEIIGSASVLSHYSSLKYPWTNTFGVLEYCRERETKSFFSFFGVYRSDRIPKATDDIGVHFFIHSYYLQRRTHDGKWLAVKKLSA